MSASRGFLGLKKGIQYGPRITAGRFSETSKTGGSERTEPGGDEGGRARAKFLRMTEPSRSGASGIPRGARRRRPRERAPRRTRISSVVVESGRQAAISTRRWFRKPARTRAFEARGRRRAIPIVRKNIPKDLTDAEGRSRPHLVSCARGCVRLATGTSIGWRRAPKDCIARRKNAARARARRSRPNRGDGTPRTHLLRITASGCSLGEGESCAVKWTGCRLRRALYPLDEAFPPVAHRRKMDPLVEVAC